jgi:hypothetical protein
MKNGERLSERQIKTLRHLAITCSNGGMVTLTRDQREAMVPLWRHNIVEIWHRQIPGEPSRGPFFKPSGLGWALIRSILAGGQKAEQEAA